MVGLGGEGVFGRRARLSDVGTVRFVPSQSQPRRREQAEAGVSDGYRADFLGHGVDVNERNYKTEMDIELVRARMGQSMALDRSEPVAAVRDIFGIDPDSETLVSR